jgi:predicted phosphodiesterase
MRNIITRIDAPSRADKYRIVLIGDVHLGNKRADEGLLRRVVEGIAEDDHAFWLGVGDYCEFIDMRDPRFDPNELVGWLMGADQLRDIAQAETRRLLEILQPIARKCLGLVEGNHEFRQLERAGQDVYARLVEGLSGGKRELRLDSRGTIMLIARRGSNVKTAYTLRIAVTHGSTAGRKGGAVANRLEDIMAQFDNVDVVVSGHAHRPQHIPLRKVRLTTKGVVSVVAHAICIPAMCADMAYADRRDLPALPTGYAELLWHPARHTVDVQFHLA